MLEDTSKFKRVNIEEGKALNHLIHMEERIIRLLKNPQRITLRNLEIISINNIKT